MRKTRSFVAIVMTVLLTCLLATACGNGNVVATGGQEKESVDTESISIEVEAQLAGVEVIDHTGEDEHVDYDALPDIDVDSGAVWTDSSNPESAPESTTSVSEPEPEVLEPEPESVISEPEPEPESVISEPEPEYQNPGTHGGYLHEVGGARFYTEHDINQWLKPNDRHPELTDFDIGQMLIDIWCENGGGLIENKVGFSYTNGEEWANGIWFEVPDVDSENVFHMVTIMYSSGGVEYTTAIRIYDYPKPFPDYWSTDYYYVLDQYYHGIHADMAPLILLAIERMEANPHDGVLNDLNLNENFYCD